MTRVLTQRCHLTFKQESYKNYSSLNMTVSLIIPVRSFDGFHFLYVSGENCYDCRHVCRLW